MKKIINRLFYTIFCVMMVSGAFAQTASLAPSTPSLSPMDKSLSDPVMSRRLQTDLMYRNPQLGSSPSINWYEGGLGYYGTYSVRNEDYMTRYDKDGRYIETLKKGDWDDSGVPAELKTSFGKSAYKSRQVTSYWSVSDPDKKGYYLELQNKQGKNSRVWANEKGEISTTPHKWTTSIR